MSLFFHYQKIFTNYRFPVFSGLIPFSYGKGEVYVNLTLELSMKAQMGVGC